MISIRGIALDVAQRTIRGYGWKPDLPDPRDRVVEPRKKAVRVPRSADLRPGMPPVYDQGDLGSCTANAIGAAVQYIRRLEGQEDFAPSRLFIYYNERKIENTVDQDAGAEIRNGMKAVNKLGACPEGLWGYDQAKFSEMPPSRCYEAAKKDLVCSYARVPQASSDLRAAVSRRRPVVFGFSVPESFEGEEVEKSGVLKMPGKDDAYGGGHAVLMVGYDDARRAALIRNSWGASWGEGGHFWMPYDFLLNPNICDDFWVVNDVT